MMVSFAWRRCLSAVVAGTVVIACTLSAVAQREKVGRPTDRQQPSRSTPRDGASPTATSDYPTLADALFDKRDPNYKRALETFLALTPADVPDQETRGKIARGFRDVALRQDWDQKEGIRGLMIWGGKYSVPILVETIEKARVGGPQESFDALGELKDARGAEAVARQLGKPFNHAPAIRCLRAMGPVAEDALIAIAPSNDRDVSLAAVELLGDVGTEKSLPLLRQAVRSSNPEVKSAANASIQRIRTRSRRGEEEGAAATPLATAADWSQVATIAPDAPVGQTVAADPAPSQPPLGMQPIRLQPPPGTTERPALLVVSGGSEPEAVVVHQNLGVPKSSRLEWVDLRPGKSTGSFVIPRNVTRCVPSPRGKRLVLVEDGPSSSGNAITEVWERQAGAADVIASWDPIPNGDPFSEKLAWIEWLDDDHLFTMDGRGKLVLWQLPRAVAKYQTELDWATPALSPGRANLAASSQSQTRIFDARSGQPLSQLARPRALPKCYAFDRSGERLAAAGHKYVCAWDLTSGQLTYQCTLDAVIGPASVEWIDADHLLVSSTAYDLLVDLSRGVIAWKYEPGVHSVSARYGGVRWHALTGRLVPLPVPHEAALAATSHLNPDEIRALQPAAKISLDLQVPDEIRGEVAAIFREAIEQTGFSVADDQPIRVVASVAAGDNVELKFMNLGLGGPPRNERLSAATRVYTASILVDGQELIAFRTIQSPIGVAVRRGETPQQAVDRVMAIDSEFFRTKLGFWFPREAVHPKFVGPYGTSRIMPEAIQ